MLKILQDVTIRHDGKEIHCKVGQVVNVKASFDINDDVARGTEIRYADKLRNFVTRVNPTEKSNVVILKTEPVHNAVEQAKRSASEEIAEPKDDVPEDKPKDDLPDDVPEYETEKKETGESLKHSGEEKPKVTGKGKGKKVEDGKTK